MVEVMAGKRLTLMRNCAGLHTGIAGVRVQYNSETGLMFLQGCENVVVSRGGRISRRLGTDNKNATAMLDIFSDGVDCIAHSGDAIYRVLADYSVVGLRNNLSDDLPMFFAKSPEGIFYNNGAERGLVKRFGGSFIWDRGEEEYSPVGSLLLSGPPQDMRHIHYHNGRMLCAVEKTVYYSDYRSYGNFYYERDMLQFPDKVIGFASAGKTLFVFTEKHVFAYVGDTMKDAMEVHAANTPLIEGTVAINDAVRSEMNTLPMWLTRNGLCAGGPDGTVRCVTEDRLVLPSDIVRGKATCHKGQYVAILSR
jgi:hypothetical protein